MYTEVPPTAEVIAALGLTAMQKHELKRGGGQSFASVLFVAALRITHLSDVSH